QHGHPSVVNVVRVPSRPADVRLELRAQNGEVDDCHPWGRLRLDANDHVREPVTGELRDCHRGEKTARGTPLSNLTARRARPGSATSMATQPTGVATGMTTPTR